MVLFIWLFKHIAGFLLYKRVETTGNVNSDKQLGCVVLKLLLNNDALY